MHLSILEDIADSDTNAIFFGYAPLSFLESFFQAKSLKAMHVQMREKFYNSYYGFYSDDFNARGTKDFIRKLFYRSGTEIMKVLIKEIENHITTVYKEKSISFQKSLINRAILAAKVEVFNIDKFTLRDGSPNLRYQIENLLLGIETQESSDRYFTYNREENIHERKIIFNTVIVNGEPLSIQLSKDKFADKEIFFWRSGPTHQDSNDGTSIDFKKSDIPYQVLNQGAILNRVEVLRKIIKEAGGKVKIYVAPNLCEKTIKGNLKQIGYQYAYDVFTRLIPPSIDGNDARHFTIDLTSESRAEKDTNNMKLKYIVALSMTYEPSQSARKDIQDYLFIVKSYEINKMKVTYETDSAICIFDSYRFYKLEEIFSAQEGIQKYRPIKLNNFVNDLDWEDLTKKWVGNTDFWILNKNELLTKYGFKIWW